MLMENRQNMMRNRNVQQQQHPAMQGEASFRGVPAPKQKQKRKLTPPPKSMANGGAAVAAPALEGDIHARNLNAAIENTFFQDYWDE